MKGGVSLVLNQNVFNNQEAWKAKGYAMSETNLYLSTSPESGQTQAFQTSRGILDQIVQEGARRMLQEAIETEVDEFIRKHQSLKIENGKQRIVRNGRQKPREILTGAGLLEVKRPRVRDRKKGAEEKIQFDPKILPLYLRRSKNIDELIPWLYLKGISTGDFSEALTALLGPNAKNLSKDTIVRLKSQWTNDYEAWNKRDLHGKRYVYIWADGIYFNIRLEEDRQCILVIMGATPDGKKELIAVTDGFRESEQSWHEIFVDLKLRGLQTAPKLAIGDGALGFWAALRKDFPGTEEQRCWVHKTANVINKLPKKRQDKAKRLLHEIYRAESAAEADKNFDRFVESYQAKYPEAAKCLAKDRSVLLTFYQFPAEQWQHIRSTNPIESTFATVRLRHRRTKGNGSAKACLAMVFKLCENASKNWRKLKGYKLLPEVMNGVEFKDGLRIAA